MQNLSNLFVFIFVPWRFPLLVKPDKLAAKPDPSLSNIKTNLLETFGIHRFSAGTTVGRRRKYSIVNELIEPCP